MLSTIFKNRIHITICSMLGIWSACTMQGLKADLTLIAIVTLLITAIYQWNRLTDKIEDEINCQEDYKYAKTEKNRIIFICLFLIGAVLYISYFFYSFNVFLIVICSAFMGLLYSTPGLVFKDNKRLKNFLGIKNISSSIGWAFGLVLFPLFLKNQPIHSLNIILFFYSFVHVLNLEILWDIRDIEGDKRAKIQTLPIKIGVKKSSGIVYVLNLSIMTIMSFLALNEWIPLTWLLLLINSIVLHVLFIFCEKKIYERFFSNFLLILQAIHLLLICIVFSM